MPPIPSSAAIPAPSPRVGIGRQVVLACLFLGLALPIIAVVGTGGLPIGRTVHVSVDGRSLSFVSFKHTVGDVMAASRIPLHEGDRVTPARDMLVWPGIEISVVRALPVTLRVDGKVSTARVAATTVGEALKLRGVALGSLDRVYPDRSTPLAQTTKITVERRELRTWVQQAPIAFISRTVNDPEVFKGNTLVRSAGTPGLRQRSVRAIYADGRPAAATPEAWTVVRPPVPRVTAVGTRAMIASRGPFLGREYMIVEATAYYSGPNNYGGAIGPYTAIGLLAQRGVIAVDPSVIPLGTRVYVEGYGYAVAGDTGGAIQGRRIDLCFNSYDEAVAYGRRTTTIYILGR